MDSTPLEQLQRGSHIYTKYPITTQLRYDTTLSNGLLFIFTFISASLEDSPFFFSPCEVTYAADSCLRRIYLTLGLGQKTLEENHKSLAPFPFFQLLLKEIKYSLSGLGTGF